MSALHPNMLLMLCYWSKPHSFTARFVLLDVRTVARLFIFFALPKSQLNCLLARTLVLFAYLPFCVNKIRSGVTSLCYVIECYDNYRPILSFDLRVRLIYYLNNIYKHFNCFINLLHYTLLFIIFLNVVNRAC